MDELGLQSIAAKAAMDPKTGKFVSANLRSKEDRDKSLPMSRLVQKKTKEGGVIGPTAKHPDFARMTAEVRGQKRHYWNWYGFKIFGSSK